jgi:membrane protease YdiL (CAAX protease family)
VTTDSPLVSQEISPPTPNAPVAETWHTVVLLFVLVAWASWGYIGTHRPEYTQQPNRLFTYIVTAVWEWLVVAYIAWGVRRNGMRFRELLGNRWNKFTDFLKDFGIAVAFWIFALVVLLCVGFMLHLTHRQQSVQQMLPQTPLEIGVWVLVALTAGFCEETIFRGYLQRQLISWTGNVSAGVVFSAIMFGAAHIYGGLKSAILIAVFGLLFGMLAEWRRSLIPGMMTHAWQDALAGIAARYVKM